LEQEEYEQERTKQLELQGYKVIPKGDDVRFWNNDVVKDIESVIRAINQALENGK
jgi:very-short-patch-repair endonuclease